MSRFVPKLSLSSPSRVTPTIPTAEGLPDEVVVVIAKMAVSVVLWNKDARASFFKTREGILLLEIIRFYFVHLFVVDLRVFCCYVLVHVLSFSKDAATESLLTYRKYEHDFEYNDGTRVRNLTL